MAAVHVSDVSYIQLYSLVVSKQPNYHNLIPYFDGVSNWKQLGVYLLPTKYASKINDIEKNHKQDVEECRWALITEYLKVGEVSWNKVIYALEKSGHPNIAEKIRGNIFIMDASVTNMSNTDQEIPKQSIGKVNNCSVFIVI